PYRLRPYLRAPAARQLQEPDPKRESHSPWAFGEKAGNECPQVGRWVVLAVSGLQHKSSKEPAQFQEDIHALLFDSVRINPPTVAAARSGSNNDAQVFSKADVNERNRKSALGLDHATPAFRNPFPGAGISAFQRNIDVMLWREEKRHIGQLRACVQRFDVRGEKPRRADRVSR